MTPIVKTATGKEFNAESCRASAFGAYDVMSIRLDGYQIMDVAPTFCNAEETQTIEFTNDDGDTKTFVGFTNIVGIDMFADRSGLEITLTNQHFD